MKNLLLDFYEYLCYEQKFSRIFRHTFQREGFDTNFLCEYCIHRYSVSHFHDNCIGRSAFSKIHILFFNKRLHAKMMSFCQKIYAWQCSGFFTDRKIIINARKCFILTLDVFWQIYWCIEVNLLYFFSAWIFSFIFIKNPKYNQAWIFENLFKPWYFDNWKKKKKDFAITSKNYLKSSLKALFHFCRTCCKKEIISNDSYYMIYSDRIWNIRTLLNKRIIKQWKKTS